MRDLRARLTAKVADFTRNFYGPEHTAPNMCPFPAGAKGRVDDAAATMYLQSKLRVSGNTPKPKSCLIGFYDCNDSVPEPHGNHVNPLQQLLQKLQ